MKKNGKFALAILPVFWVFFASCRSTPEEVKGIPIENPQVQEKEAFVETLKENYAAYSVLTTSFILKGKIDRQDQYFEGYLKATSSAQGDTLYILLKDTVFKSPIFSVYIAGGKVTQKDFLKNKTEVIPMEKYQWVVLFGDLFPFQFFYPIMRGYLPEDIFSRDSKYVKTENKIIYTSAYYDAAFLFTGKTSLSKLFYKNKMNNDILLFEIYGKSSPANARHFPKNLYIRRQGTEDFLKIDFFSCRIK